MHVISRATISEGELRMENQNQIIEPISAQNNCSNVASGHTEKPPC